jgi:hypothetical protein
MSTDINYLNLMDSYLCANPHRQQVYFRFLHTNKNDDANHLASRFLRAEFIQSKCSSFKVKP